MLVNFGSWIHGDPDPSGQDLGAIIFEIAELNSYRQTVRNGVDESGRLIEVVHYVALFVIGARFVWSAALVYAGVMM
jgi:hypothetical protein